MTSGGVTYGAGVCGEAIDRPNVAFFQPIGEILQRYGLRLRVR